MKDFYLVGIFLWPLATFAIAQTEFKYIKDFCQSPTDNSKYYFYNDGNSFIPRLEKRLHSSSFEGFNPDLFQMTQLHQKMKAKSSSFDFSIDELFKIYHDESWVLELFDHALDIVTMTCPDWLISHPLLKIIRQNFIRMCIQSHLETKNITKANLKFENDHKGFTSSMWKVVNFEASRCKHRLNQTTDFKQIIENAYKIMGDEYRTFTPNYFKGNGKYSFQDRYDVILEFVWLIGQYVGALCQAIEENIYDFLPNFMNMYDKFYMQAMENQWKSPKSINQVQQDYKFLLGGFDYKIEYEKLGFCATHAFEMTPNLKPTEKFEEMITKPRLIRMHV